MYVITKLYELHSRKCLPAIDTYRNVSSYDFTHWGWTGAPSHVGTTTQSVEQSIFSSEIAFAHPIWRLRQAQHVSLDTQRCGMQSCYRDTHLQWAGATSDALMATESHHLNIFSLWNRPVLSENSCAT